MKSSKNVRLSLEVLEDRMALSGFGGAIGGGIPSLTPVSANGSTVVVPPGTVSVPGFRNSGFYSYLTFAPGPSVQSQVQAFQSQLQAFQDSQTAMFNQFFNEVSFILQSLHINNLVVS